MKNDYSRQLDHPIKDGRSYNMGRPTVPVIQLSLLGEYIAEYPSLKEASSATRVVASDISNCCTGKRWSAGGYRWKYRQDATEQEG